MNGNETESEKRRRRRGRRKEEEELLHAVDATIRDANSTANLSKKKTTKKK
jgi:hypothetical protein